MFMTILSAAVCVAIADGPPPELANSPLATGDLPIRRDTRTVSLDYSTYLKEVEVYRRERETPQSPWSGKLQVLSTSYFILDARLQCDDSSLFITGVYPKRPSETVGESVVEVWSFDHAKSVDANGQYIPIAQRRNPTVTRREVFRGSALGHIRSIEPDPENRFVLALTYETPRVVRFDLAGGQQTVLHDTSTIGTLGLFKGIVVRHHVTEGRMYAFSMASRWDSQVDLPSGVSESILVLRDSDNDGVFDAPAYFTPEQWSSAGYLAPGAFTDLCQ